MRGSAVLADRIAITEADWCPTMQALIERLAFKYQFNVFVAGNPLVLALPDSAERLLLSGLSGERVAVTHCFANTEDQLALDLDMVFLLGEADLRPVELLFTDAPWAVFAQVMAATDGAQAQGDAGCLNLALFAEAWAQLLIQQGWLDESQHLSS